MHRFLLPSVGSARAAVALVATALFPLVVYAQATPPDLEPLNEEPSPSVTIRSEPNAGGRKIIETREQGRTTSIRVQSGTNSYQLKPNQPAGSAQPGDIQSDTTRAPLWQILEFDWNRGPEAEAAARAARDADLPSPPPPLPATGTGQ